MRKIILIVLLLGFGVTGYCQFFPVKANKSDSIEVVNKINGTWKYIGYYYMPISSNYPIDKHPTFIIGKDSCITFTDTFVNYVCKVENANTGYLYEDYDFKSVDTTYKAYNIELSTRNLPISIKKNCRNPYYTLVCEFLYYKNVIYYDKDGIVYKFKKIK